MLRYLLAPSLGDASLELAPDEPPEEDPAEALKHIPQVA